MCAENKDQSTKESPTPRSSNLLGSNQVVGMSQQGLVDTGQHDIPIRPKNLLGSNPILGMK